MKKIGKVGIIVIIAVILIVIGVCAWVFTLMSKPREAITFERFKEYTEASQYEFQDNKDVVPVDVVGKSCAANIKEYVQVEFTECVSTDVARIGFNNYITYVEQFKEKSVIEKTINFKDYGYYSMETGSMYIQIVRIDNTIMHYRVPRENDNKEIVRDFMKDLGYLD